jgi:hypothetical protein
MDISRFFNKLSTLNTSFAALGYLDELANKHFNPASQFCSSEKVNAIYLEQEILRNSLDNIFLKEFHKSLSHQQILITHLNDHGLPTTNFINASPYEIKVQGNNSFDILRGLLKYFDNLFKLYTIISEGKNNSKIDYLPKATTFYFDQIKFFLEEVFKPIIQTSTSVIARIITSESLSQILKNNNFDLEIPTLDNLSRKYKDSVFGLSDEDIFYFCYEVDEFKNAFKETYYLYQAHPDSFISSMKKDINFSTLNQVFDNPNSNAMYLVARMVKNGNIEKLDNFMRNLGANPPVFLPTIDTEKIDYSVLGNLLKSDFNKEQFLQDIVPFLKGEKSTTNKGLYTTFLFLQAHLRPDKGITIEELRNSLKPRGAVTVS